MRNDQDHKKPNEVIFMELNGFPISNKVKIREGEKWEATDEIPGPWWSWPVLGDLPNFKDSAIRRVQDLVNQYGGIVQVNLVGDGPVLVVSEPKIASALSRAQKSTNFYKKEFAKPENYNEDGTVRDVEGEQELVKQGVFWDELRAIVESSVFTGGNAWWWHKDDMLRALRRGLGGFVATFHEVIDQGLKNITPDEAVDLNLHTKELAFSLITGIMFGEEFSKTIDLYKLRQSFKVILNYLSWGALIKSPIKRTILEKTSWLWSPNDPIATHADLQEAVEDVHAFVESIVDTYLNFKQSGKDLPDSYVIELLNGIEFDPEKCKNDAKYKRKKITEVESRVISMLFAGHETTAKFIEWGWYEFARDPEFLLKLREKIQQENIDVDFFQKDRLEIVYEEIKNSGIDFNVGKESTLADISTLIMQCGVDPGFISIERVKNISEGIKQSEKDIHSIYESIADLMIQQAGPAIQQKVRNSDLDFNPNNRQSPLAPTFQFMKGLGIDSDYIDSAAVEAATAELAEKYKKAEILGKVKSAGIDFNAFNKAKFNNLLELFKLFEEIKKSDNDVNAIIQPIVKIVVKLKQNGTVFDADSFDELVENFYDASLSMVYNENNNFIVEKTVWNLCTYLAKQNISNLNAIAEFTKIFKLFKEYNIDINTLNKAGINNLSEQLNNFELGSDSIIQATVDLAVEFKLAKIRSQLPELVAFRKEVGRKCSPSFSLPREINKDVILEVDGKYYFIPKGTPVLSSMLTSQHNPEAFADPEKFDRERFLKKQSKQQEDSYFPFGVGSHICPGMDIGNAEADLAFIQLVMSGLVPELVTAPEDVHPEIRGTVDSGEMRVKFTRSEASPQPHPQNDKAPQETGVPVENVSKKRKIEWIVDENIENIANKKLKQENSSYQAGLFGQSNNNILKQQAFEASGENRPNFQI